MNLKPCPICGKTPVLSEAGDYPIYYKFFCGAHVSCGDWFPNTLGAARDWNRRTTDTNQPDLHKTTNADRIRDMSDEELDEFVLELAEKALVWLRKPAEGEDNA